MMKTYVTKILFDNLKDMRLKLAKKEKSTTLYNM